MNLLDGLASYWKLDENTGSTTYDSVGSVNGTLSNTSIWASSSKIKSGIDYSSGKHTLSFGNNYNMAKNSFSISLWAYLDNTASKNNYLLGKGDYWGNTLRYCILHSTQWGLFEFEIATGSARRIFSFIASGKTISDYRGKWIMVSVSVNKSTGKVLTYVDGELTNTYNYTDDLNLNPVSNLVSGWIPGGGTADERYGTDRVDEICFWNRVVSGDEFKYLYEIQHNGSPTGQYPFSSSGLFFGGGI
jgi:hypothetical protein